MPTPLIPPATPIELIPAGTAVGAGVNGQTFAAPAQASLVTWQIIYGTAPAAVSIELQGSNDGVNFTAIDNTTTLVSGSVRITASSARFLRARMVSVTGGDTWQVIVSASPMGLGGDLYANSIVKIGGAVDRVGLTGTTTADETLFSMAINARSFITTNRSIRIEAFGTTGANAAVKTVRVRSAAVVSTDTYTALNGPVNNVAWAVDYIISRIGFSQFVRKGQGTISGVLPVVDVQRGVGLDETVGWTLSVVGATGTATTDNVVLHQVIVSTIPGIPNII